MENLISLIIDLLSALFRGSKDEKESPQRPVTRPDPSRPDPSRPRPQARPSSWEDELRRLLEGQAPTVSPPPQRPAPAASPQPPRVITVPPQPVLRPVPVSFPRMEPKLSPPPLPPGVEMANRQLATLSESNAAYTRASQLDKSAAARIERVPGQMVQLTTVTRQTVSTEAAQVVALFRNPRAARQAVIASVIFGAPRAFEERTFTNL